MKCSFCHKKLESLGHSFLVFRLCDECYKRMEARQEESQKLRSAKHGL